MNNRKIVLKIKHDTGEILDEFISLVDASTKLNKNLSMILNIINNKVIIDGYTLKYKNISDINVRNSTRKVYKYNTNTKELIEYKNIEEVVSIEKIKVATLLKKIRKKSISKIDRDFKGILFSFDNPLEKQVKKIKKEPIIKLSYYAKTINKFYNIYDNIYCYTSEKHGKEYNNSDLYDKENGKEIWKVCANYPNYFISTFGRIKSVKLNKISNIKPNICGYTLKGINNNSLSIQKLVYTTFVGPYPDYMTIDHINRIRHDNRLCNLRLATRTEQNYNRYLQEKCLKFKINKIDPKTRKILKTYKYKSELIKDNYKNMHHKVDTNRIYYGFIFEHEKYKPIKGEIWKQTIESETTFISSYGRVKNKDRIIYMNENDSGYYMIRINKNRYYLHVLVAKYFLPNYEYYEKNHKNGKVVVNHKNGNKLDNRAENLEIITGKENIQHAFDTGLNKGSCKKEILKIQNDTNKVLREYPSIKSLAEDIKLSFTRTSSIINNKIIQNGFRYEYKYKIDINLRNTHRKVYKYNTKTNELTVYNSVEEVAEKENIKIPTIHKKICQKTISKSRELKDCLFSYNNPLENY
jgi:hypothetical protein